MRAMFEKSGAVAAPLGKNGEITEWLAVKERDDGRVRSMTMAEAMDYHDNVVWKFSRSTGDVHTSAHLITALVYGDKVTPHDYQSTFQAEMIVIPIEEMLRCVVGSSTLYRSTDNKNKDKAQDSFIRSAGIHFEMFYARSMLFRTLMYEILQARREQGHHQTLNELQEEVNHDRDKIESLAKGFGISFLSEGQAGMRGAFAAQAQDRSYFVRWGDNGLEASLPPEGDDFHNYTAYPKEFLEQVFERVWPVIQLMRDRQEELEQKSSQYVGRIDVFDYVEVAELKMVMEGIPVPTPMPTIPVAPKRQPALDTI